MPKIMSFLLKNRPSMGAVPPDPLCPLNPKFALSQYDFLIELNGERKRLWKQFFIVHLPRFHALCSVVSFYVVAGIVVT